MSRFIYLFLISTVTANILAKEPLPGFNELRVDDSEKIIENIKSSLPQGLISIEHQSGKLLYNPRINKLSERQLKQKFMMPAMIVAKQDGLKLVKEEPMSCFIISAGELLETEYMRYRQHMVLKYLQNVKNYNCNKVLICEPFQANVNTWKDTLDQTVDNDYIINDYKSINEEYFYYYVDKNGSFEMYFQNF